MTMIVLVKFVTKRSYFLASIFFVAVTLYPTQNLQANQDAIAIAGLITIINNIIDNSDDIIEIEFDVLNEKMDKSINSSLILSRQIDLLSKQIDGLVYDNILSGDIRRVFRKTYSVWKASEKLLLEKLNSPKYIYSKEKTVSFDKILGELTTLPYEIESFTREIDSSIALISTIDLAALSLSNAYYISVLSSREKGVNVDSKFYTEKLFTLKSILSKIKDSNVLSDHSAYENNLAISKINNSIVFQNIGVVSSHMTINIDKKVSLCFSSNLIEEKYTTDEQKFNNKLVAGCVLTAGASCFTPLAPACASLIAACTVMADGESHIRTYTLEARLQFPIRINKTNLLIQIDADSPVFSKKLSFKKSYTHTVAKDCIAQKFISKDNGEIKLKSIFNGFLKDISRINGHFSNSNIYLNAGEVLLSSISLLSKINMLIREEPEESVMDSLF